MAGLVRGADGGRTDPGTVVGESSGPRPWKERLLGPGQRVAMHERHRKEE